MDIKQEINEVLLKYKTLSYNSNSNHISGELFISKDDSYDILIDLSSYPSSFPNVFETSERIPIKVDRHIYTDTGSCCLTTKAKAQVLLKTQITSLTIFIKEIVIPYFQNNSYFEINKKYKTDEHSHGVLGIVEGYRDILKMNKDYLIAKLMYNRINGEKLKIHNNCYCGSGITLKKCTSGLHDKHYRLFKKIDKPLLEYDLYNYLAKHLTLK